MTFPIVNPATGDLVRQHDRMSAAQAATCIEQAHAAWLIWKSKSYTQRRQVVNAAAALLTQHRDRLANRITTEMGKPITEALGEIDKCAWVCQWYAQHAEALLADERMTLESAQVRVVRRPLGVLYAIMPWNFPLWQVFRAAAPNLMAGNAMVLKHAPNVLGCAQDITDLWRHAGVPEGLFVDLPIDIEDSPAVIAHPKVRGVTLTGSDRAGRIVAAQAGHALKKCVLELGGSDPGIVLHDADLMLAADRCVSSRMLNCGQVCIAIKRLIVVDEHYDTMRDAVHERLSALQLGPPHDPATTLGPMAREDLRDTLHHQVSESIARGASLTLGGTIPEQAGWWYPPTMLENVTPGMPAFDEEMFGPVACLIRAADDDHAIELAASTRYGLAGSVFTADRERGEAIAADRLPAGCVTVNDFTRSDPRVPFGGIHDSGFGRELAASGLHEFMNLKSVVVANTD